MSRNKVCRAQQMTTNLSVGELSGWSSGDDLTHRCDLSCSGGEEDEVEEEVVGMEKSKESVGGRWLDSTNDTAGKGEEQGRGAKEGDTPTSGEELHTAEKVKHILLFDEFIVHYCTTVHSCTTCKYWRRNKLFSCFPQEGAVSHFSVRVTELERW